MNAQSKDARDAIQAAHPGESPSVDDHNPWLGLASFTEETRGFFYGREAEVAELSRRVQRKRLTVLFGQSGLGKTSILRAGLVPRLRAQGYCPVYVRIDYAREAPEPAEQIKQAIERTARRSGRWTQVGVAVAGESLWEFLHHRDDVLCDESGATLIPLLIFDQFEEIFTLAQTDEFGRTRAARFIQDLADLVENRPPRDLEAKLDEDDSAAERFDFARSDYRVLIALREDYLAPLEGLKTSMPSVTQNRLRLAPMTGTQALAAVQKPGKGLVSEEVAAAIVRFVAGGGELANAEVEPSLLSLICRELNDTRLAQGRSEISLDLLAGSHASILSNFYERCLADQPQAVRRVIEDELLTESGFRENVAEEKLLGSFAAVGAAPDALAVLVNRRLLRIEERLDVRRVELTHDVLCGVVKNSRDVRKEREARDASERLLAEQRDRAQAARHSLVRARKIAAFCSILAVLAGLAALLAYFSTERAQRAERRADETRAVADQSRIQAEQLISYLTDDFSRELESFGRLDVVAELAKRQVDYFNALPTQLKGRDTERNGAKAMIHYAAASRRMGNLEDAAKFSAAASRILTGLRHDGDRSERTTIALAQAMETEAATMFDQGRRNTVPIAQQAAELLKPLAESPEASLAARRAYIDILQSLGYEQMRAQDYEHGTQSLSVAMRIAVETGARELKLEDVAAQYAYTGGWQVEALSNLGRHDEARAVAAQAGEVAERLIARRPGHLIALKSLQLIAANAGFMDMDDMRPAEAAAESRRATAASESILRFDPNNRVAAFNLSVDRQLASGALWRMGQPRQSLDELQSALKIVSGRKNNPANVNFFLFESYLAAERLADTGEVAGVAPVIAEAERQVAAVRARESADSPAPDLATCGVELIRSAVALPTANPTVARDLSRQCLARLGNVKPRDPRERNDVQETSFFALYLLGQAEYLLGDYGAAEQTLRAALAARARYPLRSSIEERDRASASTLFAMSLARQDKSAEARTAIGPVVKLQRALAPANHGDQLQKIELAAALYAQALAEPGKRAALLTEARSLIASVPAAMRSLRSVTLWRDRIEAASRAPPPVAEARPPKRDAEDQNRSPSLIGTSCI